MSSPTKHFLAKVLAVLIAHALVGFALLSTARAKGDTRSVSQPSSIARRGLPCGQAAVNPPTGVHTAPGPVSSRASDAAAHTAKAAGGRKISSVLSHV